MSTERKGWIGVDLDGTLARYDGWEGIEKIGEPLKPMADLVRHWLSNGLTVKIMTARVSRDAGEQVERAREVIQDWCEKHFGQRLEVTCEKDFSMITLYDDRARQVEHNTGRILTTS